MGRVWTRPRASTGLPQGRLRLVDRVSGLSMDQLRAFVDGESGIEIVSGNPAHTSAGTQYKTPTKTRRLGRFLGTGTTNTFPLRPAPSRAEFTGIAQIIVDLNYGLSPSNSVLVRMSNSSNEGVSLKINGTGYSGTGNSVNRLQLTLQGVADYSATTSSFGTGGDGVVYTVGVTCANGTALFMASDGLRETQAIGAIKRPASTAPYLEDFVPTSGLTRTLFTALLQFGVYRAVDEATLESLIRNPWQLVKPANDRVFVSPATGPEPPVTVDAPLFFGPNF